MLRAASFLIFLSLASLHAQSSDEHTLTVSKAVKLMDSAKLQERNVSRAYLLQQAPHLDLDREGVEGKLLLELSRKWADLMICNEQADQYLQQFGAQDQLSPVEQSQYLALLKATGDLDTVNTLVDSPESAYHAGRALLSGDFDTYAAWWQREYSELSDTIVPNTLSRLAGQWDEITPPSSSDRPRHIVELIAHGQLSQAYDQLTRAEKQLVPQYLTERYRYDEFFQLFDFPSDRTLSESWIRENIQTHPDQWWFTNVDSPLFTVGKQLLRLGDDQNLILMLEPIWDTVAADNSLSIDFISQLHAEGYFIQAIHFSKFVSPQVYSQLPSIFLPTNKIYVYLENLIQQKLPRTTLPEKIELMLALTGGNIYSQQTSDRVSFILEEILQDCIRNPDDSLRETYLASCYNSLGYKEKVLNYHLSEQAKWANWQLLNKVLTHQVFLDHWDDAASTVARMTNAGQDNELFLEVRKAAILENGGRTEMADEIYHTIDQTVINSPSTLLKIAKILLALHLPERADYYLTKALNVTTPSEYNGFIWDRLIEQATLVQAAAKNYQQAAIFTEARILYATKTALNNETLLQTSAGHIYLQRLASLRYQADLYWLQHLADETFADHATARPITLQLIEEWNGSGIMGDDLYPLLVKQGLTSVLQHSLHSTLPLYRDLIARYPNAHNLKNTASWLASRAQLELDEALSYSSAAIASNPRNASFLDTMAEIQFALGDRDQALEYSQRAWKDAIQSGGDTLIKKQYYHFLHDPLPNQ